MSSPYGEKLEELLRQREIKQKPFATAIGVLPNHVSQVISGIKGPFNYDVQKKVADVLKLTALERQELDRLAQISTRTFRLRASARSIEYQIASLLSEHSSAVPDRFLEVAKLALAAHTAVSRAICADGA
jgi:transcriptional regulator with XRE-family HTH domain